MNTRRIHPVLCYVALAAFLLPVAAASRGVVLCHEWAGKTTIELVGDHGRCSVAGGGSRDENACGCRCSAHPCKDTRLSVKIAPMPRSDETGASGVGGPPVAMATPIEAISLFSQRDSFADSREPTIDRSLGRLRSVRLII
jgi:hypothetical protein